MKRNLAVAILILIAFTVGARPFAYAQVADVPGSIPYRGHLTDADGIDLTASVQIEVRLYDSLIGGIGQGVANPHVVYAETHPGVSVERGNFLVAIGEGSPLDSKWIGLPQSALISKERLYLELWIDGERLNPRQRLSSVPAALRAQHAQYADEFSVLPQITPEMVPAYDASKIASGTFVSSQVPGLDAGRIEGVLGASVIPQIDVSKFSDVGSLDPSLLGSLSASSITSGQVSLSQIPGNTFLLDDDVALHFQPAIGGIAGGQYTLPSGFAAHECRTLFSPTVAGSVKGIDRMDLWFDPYPYLKCTVNEKHDNTGEMGECFTQVLTLCKRGG